MGRSRTTSPTPGTESRPRGARYYVLRASALIAAVAALGLMLWPAARFAGSAVRAQTTHASRRSAAPGGALSDAERRALDAIVEGDGFELATARGQMRFLEELAGWLEAHGERDVRAALARILHEAFPDRAASLMSLWNARERYAAWMREHRAELARLSPDERRARIWTARREIFGERADELFEAFRRNEAIASTLHDIDARPSDSVQSRFERYVGAIREQYGAAAPQLLAARRQELMDRFVSLPSVQSDLAALPSEERNERLRALRTSAGMDSEALDRWSTLDHVRDERWERGARYMTERAELTARLRGEALERSLSALRERYFGAEATVIANEEETGFYRFERQREYGRN